MNNKKIYKYFLISLFATVGGLVYFTMMQKNHIVIKEKPVKQLSKSDLLNKSEKEDYYGAKEQVKMKQSPKEDNIKESQTSNKQGNLETKYKLVPNEPNQLKKSNETNIKKVNINTASQDELVLLDGIGEKKAARIVEYREKNGNFTKIEDIMKIKGIKEKAFHNIKDYITVSE